jgi:hypothetical protein
MALQLVVAAAAEQAIATVGSLEPVGAAMADFPARSISASVAHRSSPERVTDPTLEAFAASRRSSAPRRKSQSKKLLD